MAQNNQILQFFSPFYFVAELFHFIICHFGFTMVSGNPYILSEAEEEDEGDVDEDESTDSCEDVSSYLDSVDDEDVRNESFVDSESGSEKSESSACGPESFGLIGISSKSVVRKSKMDSLVYKRLTKKNKNVSYTWDSLSFISSKADSDEKEGIAKDPFADDSMDEEEDNVKRRLQKKKDKRKDDTEFVDKENELKRMRKILEEKEAELAALQNLRPHSSDVESSQRKKVNEITPEKKPRSDDEKRNCVKSNDVATRRIIDDDVDKQFDDLADAKELTGSSLSEEPKSPSVNPYASRKKSYDDVNPVAREHDDVGLGVVNKNDFCYVLSGREMIIPADVYNVREMPAKSNLFIEYLKGRFAIIYVRYDDGSHDCGYVPHVIHGIELGHEFFTGNYQMFPVPLVNKRNSEKPIRNTYNRLLNYGFAVTLKNGHPLLDPELIKPYLSKFAHYLKNHNWSPTKAEIVQSFNHGRNNYNVAEKYNVTKKEKRVLGDVIEINVAVDLLKRLFHPRLLHYSNDKDRPILNTYFQPPFGKTLKLEFGMTDDMFE